jgi:hypothetical protein
MDVQVIKRGELPENELVGGDHGGAERKSTERRA